MHKDIFGNEVVGVVKKKKMLKSYLLRKRTYSLYVLWESWLLWKEGPWSI